LQELRQINAGTNDCYRTKNGDLQNAEEKKAPAKPELDFAGVIRRGRV